MGGYSPKVLETFMKTNIRIPTVQFGYLDFQFEGTPEEAITEHNRILALYNGGFGLEPKEWNKALDLYLEKGEGETEVYMQMSAEQQRVMQEIKKAFARINYKNK